VRSAVWMKKKETEKEKEWEKEQKAPANPCPSV
jgi:hypothetical protein